MFGFGLPGEYENNSPAVRLSRLFHLTWRLVPGRRRRRRRRRVGILVRLENDAGAGT